MQRCVILHLQNLIVRLPCSMSLAEAWTWMREDWCQEACTAYLTGGHGCYPVCKCARLSQRAHHGLYAQLQQKIECVKTHVRLLHQIFVGPIHVMMRL